MLTKTPSCADVPGLLHQGEFQAPCGDIITYVTPMWFPTMAHYRCQRRRPLLLCTGSHQRRNSRGSVRKWGLLSFRLSPKPKSKLNLQAKG